MKSIYLYTADKEKKAVIEKVCSQQQIRLSTLSYVDLNKTISEICGIPVKVKKEHKQAPVMFAFQEMLLFSGIDNSGLDDFLDAYNASGVEKIKMKAVVTPTNLGWTLYELIEELGKEMA